MNAALWHATADFRALGRHVCRPPWFSRRKLLLFLAARCSHLLERVPDRRVREPLMLFRRVADGGLSADELLQLEIRLDRIVRADPTPGAVELLAAVRVRALHNHPGSVIELGRYLFAEPDQPNPILDVTRADRMPRTDTPPTYPDLADADQADMLRDLFGDPFAPCDLTREQVRPWLDAAGGLAEKLFRSLVAADRLADLPVLADALEEGGCDALDLLAHLRQPSPHVHGCWAIDRLTA